MKEKINEIRMALKNGYYNAALALSLTLPDICAQIEFGKKMEVGKRYKSWIDKNFDKYLFDVPISGFEDQILNSEKIYLLRCYVLHSGNVDIQKKLKINKFVLLKPNDKETGYKYEEKYDENGNIIKTSYIRVDYLCESLCESAEKFFNSWKNKNDFEEYTIKFGN